MLLENLDLHLNHYHLELPHLLHTKYLPILLHPRPRRVLIVGFGMGSTVWGSCQHDVERVDVVELLRAEKLSAWLPLVEHLYLETADGTKARAIYDERQVGETRLSSVQYLKFPVGATAPVAFGTDLDVLPLRAELTAEQKNARSHRGQALRRLVKALGRQ